MRRHIAHIYNLKPGVDVYNLLNSNVVITQNQNFGPALGRPERVRVLQGRLVRVTAPNRLLA